MEVLQQKRPWLRVWDALVDANPVLARELLITARTPAYLRSVAAAPLLLGTFLLLVRLAMGHQGGDPVVGRLLFPVYFSGLAMALGTVGAALGSTVIVQEREAGALEALKFSSLSPGAVVLGKFAAVVLAEGAVAVCTLPMLAFVWALGGISIGESLVAMFIAVTCGVMTASIGVAASAHATHARRSLVISLLGSSALGIGVLCWMGWGAGLCDGYGPFPIGIVRAYVEAPLSGTFIAALGVVPTLGIASTLWLGYAVATSGLMDASEDRSLPIKRWTLGAFVMGLVALAICTGHASERLRDVAAGVSMFATASIAATLLFALAGEPLTPTRRMQAHPPSPLVRIVCPRCLAPSIFFTLVASGTVLLSIPVIAGASMALGFAALWTVLLLWTLGGLMGSVGARHGAPRARFVGAAALAGLVLLVALLRFDSPGAPWADGVCPLGLVGEVGISASAQRVVLSSLVGWAVTAIVSVSMLLLAVRGSTRRVSDGFSL
jgi:ABC-type transport system involved in cytochrome c biogenesis permease component